MLSKYGTIDSFMLSMSPAKQIAVSGNRKEMMIGDFPTLNNIASAYGRTAPIQWLIAQLINLSEFCGVKDKLTGDQCEELAWLIHGEYSYLKVTQFLVFFHDFKMGKFGKFYGSVDPLVITSALEEFDKVRIKTVVEHEREEERRQIEEEKKNAITFEEFIALAGVQDEEAPYDEDTMRQAKSILENSYKADGSVLSMFRKLFVKNNGLTPEEYVEKYQEELQSQA